MWARCPLGHASLIADNGVEIPLPVALSPTSEQQFAQPEAVRRGSIQPIKDFFNFNSAEQLVWTEFYADARSQAKTILDRA